MKTAQVISVLAALATAGEQLIHSGLMTPRQALVLMVATNLISSVLPALQTSKPRRR